MPKKAGREPRPSASELAERRLVDAALRKLRGGQTPSSQERAALKRFERAQEEERRWEYLRTTPKRDYMAMSGRSARVLIDQARRHGLPYPTGSREPVDLTAVIRWLHDLLSTHGQRLSAPETDDPMMAGASSPALERYREERAKLARLERLQKEGQLLPREAVHEALVRIAAILRSAGEILGREHGPEAQDVLNEALDDAQREIDRSFGEREGEGDVA